ncbi:MAG: mechanosensitive ion channel family protein [Alphaproteobacteria bacterium]
MARNKYITLSLLLFLLIIAAALVPVSLATQDLIHVTLQALRGILIIMIWGTLYYFIKISFFAHYKFVYEKDIPPIVVTVIKFILLVCTFLSIMVFVLGKNVFSIVACASAAGVAVGFALKDLVLDAFAGVVLEVEGHFDLHDWIKADDEEEGRVTQINWRTVTLESHDNYFIIVPNRKLAKGFINYSKPDEFCWDSVEISLDHSIPIDRAARILRAGVMGVPSIYQEQCKATAMRANESGITYEVRYMLPKRKHFRQVKHDVIEHIARHLHEYKLHISELLGEYSISKGGKPYEEEAPLQVENLIKDVEFFKGLPPSTIAKLATNVTTKVFAEGEIIVSEGDSGQSMFLIGEGVVEISIEYETDTGEKKQKTLFQLGYHDYFGEMALLLNESRSATVTTVMDTVVYEIAQDLLKETLKDNPEAFDNLIKQAIDKKEKNKLAKEQMEKLKEEKTDNSKGILTNLKKFFT